MKFEEMIASKKETEKFKQDGKYVFMFHPLDEKYGRIEWHIEPIIGKKKREGRYYIEGLYVWATQHQIPAYTKKVFRIPVFTECLYGSPLNKSESYFAGVWRAMPCETHKGTIVFSAYPEDKHRRLEIEVISSIMSPISFI